MPQFAVILPAAGGSTRFGGAQNKLLRNLGGAPVFARAMRAFLERTDVAQLIIATSATLLDGDQPAALRDCLEDSRVVVCAGGATRAHSVRCALERVRQEIQWVAIHDAARPLVSQALIDRTLETAMLRGAAVPAMPVALTIKQAAGPLPAPIQKTIPRQQLFAMQTPQIMRRDALEKAFAQCPVPLEQITDDVQLLELSHQPAWLVDGEERNLKITTRMDLKLAELLLADDRS